MTEMYIVWKIEGCGDDAVRRACVGGSVESGLIDVCFNEGFWVLNVCMIPTWLILRPLLRFTQLLAPINPVPVPEFLVIDIFYCSTVTMEGLMAK